MTAVAMYNRQHVTLVAKNVELVGHKKAQKLLLNTGDRMKRQREEELTQYTFGL